MSLGRLFRTVVHLRPRQIVARALRRLPRRPVKIGGAPDLRRSVAPLIDSTPREGGWNGGSEFRLLNLTARIDGPTKWHPDMPMLWNYHLHYMEDLVRSDAREWTEHHEALIRRWILDNPPFSGLGWDPYPISLRVVFWMKWALAGGELGTTMRDSLATQLRHLVVTLEYHLAGNHLWANAKALTLAGLFFQGAEADRWYRLGWSLLVRERKEQILADGGHFERSPSYHALITEDVLDLINFHDCFGRPLDSSWYQTAALMREWLATMTRSDGELVAWNDGASRSRPTAEQVEHYGQRLGLSALEASGDRWLSDTGYAKIGNGPFGVWFDMGLVGPDYLPGHAHADTLNVEVEVNGQPLIVDTGVSTYEIGPRRAFERGTKSHNCVTIDEADTSEMWASFRVGRRARPFARDFTSGYLAASHTGYRHLGAFHRRSIEASDHRTVVIRDSIERKSAESLCVARFHFAPDVKPVLDGNRVTTSLANLDFTGHRDIHIEECEIAVGFNQLVQSYRAVVQFDETLETKLST